MRKKGAYNEMIEPQRTFQEMLAQYHAEQRRQMLEANPDMPTGYCSCCGAPNG
jgi:hypothetical protein